MDIMDSVLGRDDLYKFNLNIKNSHDILTWSKTWK